MLLEDYLVHEELGNAGGKKMLHKLGQIDNARSFWHATRSGGKVLGEGLGRMFGPETLYQLKHIKTSAKAGDNLTQMAKANRLFWWIL